MIKPESSAILLSGLIILLSPLSKVDTPIHLLAASTPACSAGNCRSDPPPSPRLGGGCACYAGTSISVYPPPKSPSLEGDLLLRLSASDGVGIVAVVGFGGGGHDRFLKSIGPIGLIGLIGLIIVSLGNLVSLGIIFTIPFFPLFPLLPKLPNTP